jgi:transposase
MPQQDTGVGMTRSSKKRKLEDTDLVPS